MTSPALDVHFPDDRDVVARATARLDDCSLVAVHEIGPDEAPVWRVFFADVPARDAAARVLDEEFGDTGLKLIPVDVPDEDWAARSQAGLKSVRVGRLVVAPPWDVVGEDTRPSAPGLHVIPILIQPSMGFGTGHHETTRLCLELLQAIDLGGLEVLDVGTGSGVLAIAAALLGARHVRAVDVDDDALVSARENLGLNHDALSAARCSVDVARGNVREGLAPADLVLANLTGGLLVSAAGPLRAAVRPGGHLLVSGFQPHEAQAVLSALAPCGASIERRREGEWEAAIIDFQGHSTLNSTG